MRNIFSAIKDLKKIQQDKLKLREKQRLQKESANRIEDLFVRMHKVGNISLEIPNLFAQTQLERYFKEIGDIDLNNPKHLAACIYFFNNQTDITIAQMSHSEIDEKIQQEMVKIPLEQLDEYIYCVYEIMAAIKKKTVKSQVQMLEDLLEKIRE